MLFYIVFLLSVSGLLWLGYLYSNKNNFVQWLVLGIVVFVAGFRDNVGADYDDYVIWYTNKNRDDDFEIGFVAIMDLFRNLNLNYTYLFFFFSFLTYLFFYLGIKKYTENTNFAFLIFLLLPGLFLNSMCMLRQSFSMTIGFYAFHYLINKKYFIYVILMSIGTAIHYTCIIPFVLFFIVYKFADRIKESHLYFLLIISFIISKMNLIKILSIIFEGTRYVGYFSKENNPVSIIKLIVLNATAVFVLLYSEKIKNKYPYQKYLIVLYVISVVFTNLLSFQIDLTRIAVYFKIFETIVIADLVFLETKQRKLWLITGFYFYYFFAFMHSLRVDFDIVKSGSKFIPYKNLIIK